jgi:hypothetical protein
MKFTGISILIMTLFSMANVYGYRHIGYPECMALSKGHLHAMLEDPQKSVTIGQYRLSLKTPCSSSCGEDCGLLLHGYEEATLINPVDDEFDIYGTCVYHLGANDHIHVAVEKIR